MQKMRRSGHVLLLLAAPFLARGAVGDVLVLEDEERLSGHVARVAAGTLVFRTSLEGQMMVPMDTVRALATEENLVISFRAGEVQYGRFAQIDNAPHVVPIGGGEAKPVNLAEVEEAMVIPRPPEGGDAGPATLGAWRAALDAGVHRRGGTMDITDAVARFELRREGGEADFLAKGLVERPDRGDALRFARGSAKIAGAADSALAPYGEIQAERDVASALDLRGGLTLGVGRLLAASTEGSILGRVGANYTREEWDAHYARAHSRGRDWDDADQAERDEFNLQLGLRYSRRLFQNSQLSGDVVAYPSLSRPGDWRLRSETALTVPVANRLRLRFDLLVDYDNAPIFGAVNEWSTAIGASIGMEF